MTDLIFEKSVKMTLNSDLGFVRNKLVFLVDRGGFQL
jgi:hypothetical protein